MKLGEPTFPKWEVEQVDIAKELRHAKRRIRLQSALIHSLEKQKEDWVRIADERLKDKNVFKNSCGNLLNMIHDLKETVLYLKKDLTVDVIGAKNQAYLREKYKLEDQK